MILTAGPARAGPVTVTAGAAAPKRFREERMPSSGSLADKNIQPAADRELMLYGATGPDAFVAVSGRKVRLNPDGTFSMRSARPELQNF